MSLPSFRTPVHRTIRIDQVLSRCRAIEIDREVVAPPSAGRFQAVKKVLAMFSCIRRSPNKKTTYRREVIYSDAHTRYERAQKRAKTARECARADLQNLISAVDKVDRDLVQREMNLPTKRHVQELRDAAVAVKSGSCRHEWRGITKRVNGALDRETLRVLIRDVRTLVEKEQQLG